jgi:hypothetical protein
MSAPKSSFQLSAVSDQLSAVSGLGRVGFCRTIPPRRQQSVFFLAFRFPIADPQNPNNW